MLPSRALVKDNDDLFQARCIITSGSPIPIISWKFPTSQPLANVGTDDNKLIISKPTVHNSGTYKCIARNSLGIAEKSLIVFVARK